MLFLVFNLVVLTAEKLPKCNLKMILKLNKTCVYFRVSFMTRHVVIIKKNLSFLLFTNTQYI